MRYHELIAAVRSRCDLDCRSNFILEYHLSQVGVTRTSIEELTRCEIELITKLIAAVKSRSDMNRRIIGQVASNWNFADLGSMEHGVETHEI
jgi:hypothetical protein